jgi:hypothetical protein
VRSLNTISLKAQEKRCRPTYRSHQRDGPGRHATGTAQSGGKQGIGRRARLLFGGLLFGAGFRRCHPLLYRSFHVSKTKGRSLDNCTIEELIHEHDKKILFRCTRVTHNLTNQETAVNQNVWSPEYAQQWR